MPKPPHVLSFFLIALFLCAQLCSFSGAFETDSSLDDLDPEEIVSVDPFVSSNLRLATALPLPGPFVAYVLIGMYLLDNKSVDLRFAKLDNSDEPVCSNKLWLLHRTLLI